MIRPRSFVVQQCHDNLVSFIRIDIYPLCLCNHKHSSFCGSAIRNNNLLSISHVNHSSIHRSTCTENYFHINWQYDVKYKKINIQYCLHNYWDVSTKWNQAFDGKCVFGWIVPSLIHAPVITTNMWSTL